MPLVKQILDAELKKRGVDGQQPPLRALRLLAPGAVPARHASAASRRSTSCSRSTAGAAAATSASRRWPRSSRRAGTSSILKRRARAAAGHQRPLPRQHAAGRHLLGRAARAGRRDHAREAHRARPGGEEVRPLHEDHRRAAHRSVRRARRAAAADLGASWSTPASSAATPTARRCAR